MAQAARGGGVKDFHTELVLSVQVIQPCAASAQQFLQPEQKDEPSRRGNKKKNLH